MLEALRILAYEVAGASFVFCLGLAGGFVFAVVVDIIGWIFEEGESR